ncbi:MAG: alkene reductase [Bacteroidetes bacterium]|nr:alkene reductase [Bacteroidota bacterium]
MNHKSNLLNPISKGGITVKNRVAMAPMTRSRAIGNLPNKLIATYYAQRNNAGLIISEGNAPSPNGIGYARTPGIYSDEQIEAWKNVTKETKQNDTLFFTQLMHVGRVGHHANMVSGATLLAHSAINANVDMWTDSQAMQKTELPKEMTNNEIEQTIHEFVTASQNAIKSGFDGVEIHGANGYLIEQFLNNKTNIRTDAYGGTLENRAKFLLTLVEKVGNAIGFDKVGVRLSPYNQFNSMPLYDDIADMYSYLAIGLNKLNIAYLHIIDYAALGSEEGKKLLKDIRTQFSNLLIRNGGYNKERAEHLIDSHEADMISFGSAYIANPDLVNRIENNAEWARPDSNTFYTADAVGFTDYPLAQISS